MNCDTTSDMATHSLLEPPAPAYTHTTVRRAFIVWLYCGQRNQFRDVCNYYHHLEAMEDKLPPAMKASSRHHEFNLFSNQPPISPYLAQNFPQLYCSDHVSNYFINSIEAIRNERCVFKLEGFNEIKEKNGSTKQEIVDASVMIRKYCKERQIKLRNFLQEFLNFTEKCRLKSTVANVDLYIKRKMIEAEINMVINYPKDFSFLNITDDVLSGREKLMAALDEPEGKDYRNSFEAEFVKKLQDEISSWGILDKSTLRPIKAKAFDESKLDASASNPDKLYCCANFDISDSNFKNTYCDFQLNVGKSATSPVKNYKDILLNKNKTNFESDTQNSKPHFVPIDIVRCRKIEKIL